MNTNYLVIYVYMAGPSSQMGRIDDWLVTALWCGRGEELVAVSRGGYRGARMSGNPCQTVTHS